MLHLVPKTPSPQAKSNCPDCSADLAILRIITGRGGAEYWTMRCTECGGIHLDIVKGKKDAALAPAGDAATS
jgi:uncharacterized Zn finger protein